MPDPLATWVTNAHKDHLEKATATFTFAWTVGPPRAFPNHNVAEQAARGVVGVYRVNNKKATRRKGEVVEAPRKPMKEWWG